MCVGYPRAHPSRPTYNLVTEVRLSPDEDAKDSHVIKLYEKLAALLEMSGSRNNERGRSKGRASVSNCLRELDLEAVAQQSVR